MRHIDLSPSQRQELEDLRDHAAQPYLRERAAALLKVADGHIVATVARCGLLRQRQGRTIGVWLDRYQEGGLAALKVRSGRGRKPAFSPCRVG